MRGFLATAVVLASVMEAGIGAAQTPEGLLKQDAASSGATDVATEGFETQTAPPAEDAKDTEELSVSAGGQFATGNTRTAALTTATQFRMRRGDNQLSAAAAANLARAASAENDDLEPTAENVQGKVRYDRFLLEGFAAFLGVSARRDRFQGLNLRLNIDPGVAYYFVDEEKQQLWGELGYDLQHDIRRDENIEEAAAAGNVVEKTATRHNIRVFAGYDNKLNDGVTFTTGVEYIQSVEEGKSWRLNWDSALTSQIAGNFAAATTFSLRHDHNPLPDVEKTDIVTAVSLVVTLL